TYGRFLVEGPDARTLLDRVMANAAPAEGRIALAPMLNAKGKLIGDFTVGCVGAQKFFLVGSSIAEVYYLRWFERQRGKLDVTVRSLIGSQVGLAIAGPRSRELLGRLVREDIASAAFPFLSLRELNVGMIRCLIGRVSFTGELGFEIWCEPDHQR